MATAEQTVSAVLEQTNKRYVVETGTSEDGEVRFTRFSDGYLVIEGNVTLGKQGNSGVLTFPVSFATRKYSVNGTLHAKSNYPDVHSFKVLKDSKTEEGFSYLLCYANSNGTNYFPANGYFSFIACGY